MCAGRRSAGDDAGPAWLAGGEARGPLAQVRAAVERAKQLRRAFRTLPRFTKENAAKPVGEASGDHASSCMSASARVPTAARPKTSRSGSEACAQRQPRPARRPSRGKRHRSREVCDAGPSQRPAASTFPTLARGPSAPGPLPSRHAVVDALAVCRRALDAAARGLTALHMRRGFLANRRRRLLRLLAACRKVVWLRLRARRRRALRHRIRALRRGLSGAAYEEKQRSQDTHPRCARKPLCMVHTPSVVQLARRLSPLLRVHSRSPRRRIPTAPDSSRAAPRDRSAGLPLHPWGQVNIRGLMRCRASQSSQRRSAVWAMPHAARGQRAGRGRRDPAARRPLRHPAQSRSGRHGRGLQADPGARFQSMAELLAARALAPQPDRRMEPGGVLAGSARPLAQLAVLRWAGMRARLDLRGPAANPVAAPAQSGWFGIAVRLLASESRVQTDEVGQAQGLPLRDQRVAQGQIGERIAGV